MKIIGTYKAPVGYCDEVPKQFAHYTLVLEQSFGRWRALLLDGNGNKKAVSTKDDERAALLSVINALGSVETMKAARKAVGFAFDG